MIFIKDWMNFSKTFLIPKIIKMFIWDFIYFYYYINKNIS